MKSRQTSGTGRTGKHPVGLTQHRSAISRSNPEGRSMHDSVTDVSRETDVPRSTLYGIIGKVRAAFKDAGLEDYL